MIDGPDVWEVIQTLNSHLCGGVPATAELRDLTEQQVHIAIDYYATNSDEIDARIKLNAQTRQSWGDLSKLTETTTAEAFRRLDAEERAAGLDPW